MPSLTASSKPLRKGRVGFLKDATTTTISLEKALLKKLQVAAGFECQSVSQWIVGAAKRKLKAARMGDGK